MGLPHCGQAEHARVEELVRATGAHDHGEFSGKFSR